MKRNRRSTPQLVAALLRTRSAAQASRVLSSSGDWNADFVAALFARFHPALLASPKRAEGAVFAARILRQRHAPGMVRAWCDRIEGTYLAQCGDPVAAAKLLRRAARQFRQAGAGAEAGDAFRVSVEAYAQAGQPRNAFRAASEARRAYASARVRDPIRTGDLEVNLGAVAHQSGRPLEAYRHFRRAEQCYRRHAGKPMRVATAIINQGVVLAEIDRYGEARQAYDRARKLFAARQYSAWVRQADRCLAEVDLAEGSTDRAIATLAEVREASIKDNDLVRAAFDALELSEALAQVGRLQEAIEVAQEAVRGFRRVRRPAQVGAAMIALGTARIRTGAVRLGVRDLTKAVSLLRVTDNLTGIAIAGLGLARGFLRLGRAELSRVEARRAAQVFAQQRMPGRQARALALLAEGSLQRGQSTSARREATVAVRLARHSQDPRVEIAARAILARVHRAACEHGREYRELHRAADRLEFLRNELTREESRLAFGFESIEIYHALVENRLAVGTRRAQREALGWLEKAKARVLADRVTQTFSAEGLQARLAGVVVQRLAKVERALAVAESRVTRDQSDAGLRAAHGSEILELLDERRHTLESLQARGSRALIRCGTVIASQERVLATLAPDECILEYGFANGQLFCFVLEAGSARVVERLAAESEVQDLVERLRFQLGNGALRETRLQFVGATAVRALEYYLSRADDLFLAPLELRSSLRSLQIVPYGPLHGLPFHAFSYDGQPRVERASFSYTPSLSVLDLLRHSRRSINGDAPLVLGVPDRAAPEITREIERIAIRFPGARVRLGSNATREALRHEASQAPVLHIASHGFFAARSRPVAAVRLGDAWCDLADIYALDRTSAVVVLSGCETGRGTVHVGDEWSGLVTGFLQAGARAVVAALWELHDHSAACLMDHFYDRLSDSSPIGEAMAHAQRRLIADGVSALHWAPYAVIGDPRLVLFPRSRT